MTAISVVSQVAQVANLRDAAISDCQSRYGITPKQDPLWQGQLAAGLPMAPKDIVNSYVAYTYSRHAYKLKFPNDEFHGLQDALDLANEMGLEVVAYHSFALLIHVPDRALCGSKAWEFGRKLAESANIHILEEGDVEDYEDEVMREAYGSHVLID